MPKDRDDVPDVIKDGDLKFVAAFLFERLAPSQTPDPATVEPAATRFRAQTSLQRPT